MIINIAIYIDIAYVYRHVIYMTILSLSLETIGILHTLSLSQEKPCHASNLFSETWKGCHNICVWSFVDCNARRNFVQHVHNTTIAAEPRQTCMSFAHDLVLGILRTRFWTHLGSLLAVFETSAPAMPSSPGRYKLTLPRLTSGAGGLPLMYPTAIRTGSKWMYLFALEFHL